MQKIETIRKEIDRLDDEIVKSLVERFLLAKSIAGLKLETGISNFDANREKEIILKACISVDEEILRENIQRIYESILHESKIYQKESRGD
jgi:chorismate mutase